MNQIFLIAADYVKGRSIYSPVRRIMSLLFITSISSFLYEKFYGQYTWMDINDYKGLLNFFIKGNFFIPLSIFIIVYAGTQAVSILIFNLLNHFKVIKIIRRIVYYEVSNEEVEGSIEEISSITKRITPVDLTTPLLVDLYNNFRSKLTPEFFENIENELKAPKSNLELNFHLCFRTLLAISVYFSSITQFGWILYLSLFATLIFIMYILIIAHRFLDVLPTLVRKFHDEAEKYILAYGQNNKDL